MIPAFAIMKGFICLFIDETASGWNMVISSEKMDKMWVNFMPYILPEMDKHGNVLHQPVYGQVKSAGSIELDKTQWIPSMTRETFPASKAWVRAYPNQPEHIRYSMGQGGFRKDAKVKLPLSYVWNGERYVPSWVFNHEQKEAIQKSFHDAMTEANGDYWATLKVFKKFTKPCNDGIEKESDKQDYKAVELEVAPKARIMGGYAKSGRPMLSKVAKNLDKISGPQRQVFWSMLSHLEKHGSLEGILEP